MSKRSKKGDVLTDPQYRKTPSCSNYINVLRSKDPKIAEFPIEKLSGKQISKEFLLNTGFTEPFIVVTDPTSLEMTIPDKTFSLSDVSNVLGENFPIKVIEVGQQQQLDDWTIGKYARYFENRTKDHKILNLISLECSATPLGTMIQAPRVVRDLDWIDLHWPCKRRLHGDFPQVQKYCLAGMEGAYTDFHLDFGGTSVWYHVLWGRKRFYLIPPSVRNLKIYLDWTCSRHQDKTFLGDLVDRDNCMTVDLTAGQTLFIPSAWIHAVYTPMDSLVFGGNFLLTSCIIPQLRVFAVETRSQTHDSSSRSCNGRGDAAVNWLGGCDVMDVGVAFQRDMIRQIAVLFAFASAAGKALAACDKHTDNITDTKTSASTLVLNLWWDLLTAATKLLDDSNDNTSTATTTNSLSNFLIWIRGTAAVKMNNNDNDNDEQSSPDIWGLDLLDERLEAYLRCEDRTEVRVPLKLKLAMSSSANGNGVGVGVGVGGDSKQQPNERQENIKTEEDGDGDGFEFNEEDIDGDGVGNEEVGDGPGPGQGEGAGVGVGVGAPLSLRLCKQRLTTESDKNTNVRESETVPSKPIKLVLKLGKACTAASKTKGVSTTITIQKKKKRSGTADKVNTTTTFAFDSETTGDVAYVNRDDGDSEDDDFDDFEIEGYGEVGVGRGGKGKVKNTSSHAAGEKVQKTVVKKKPTTSVRQQLLKKMGGRGGGYRR
eukprot:gene2087-4077_t